MNSCLSIIEMYVHYEVVKRLGVCLWKQRLIYKTNHGLFEGSPFSVSCIEQNESILVNIHIYFFGKVLK